MIKPLYKAQEPFMDVKRGHGFQGVLMYDDIADKIQCHICGEWFNSVAHHASYAHKVLSADYKMEFGLTLKYPLCTKTLSNKKRVNILKQIESTGFDPRKYAAIGSKSSARKRKRPRQTIGSVQFKNKSGLCDLQIRTRYEVVRRIVGRDPHEGDLIKHDKQLYYSGIMNKPGGLNAFRKRIGRTPKTAAYFSRFDDLDVIASLRKFGSAVKGSLLYSRYKKERKKYPDLVGTNTIIRHFGSWSAALSAAGLRNRG